MVVALICFFPYLREHRRLRSVDQAISLMRTFDYTLANLRQSPVPRVTSFLLSGTKVAIAECHRRRDGEWVEQAPARYHVHHPNSRQRVLAAIAAVIMVSLCSL